MSTNQVSPLHTKPTAHDLQVSGRRRKPYRQPVQQVTSVVTTQPVAYDLQVPGRRAPYRQPGSEAGGYELMHRPIARHSTDCPPGLEYLIHLDRIVIDKYLLVYTLMNTTGTHLYLAIEDFDCCATVSLGVNRGFTINLIDELGNEVIRIKRKCRLSTLSAWCAGKDCCADQITIEAPVGTVIGYVKQKPSCCIPTCAILDADEKECLYISGPCVYCKECGYDEIDFTVYSASDGITDVGTIKPQWRKIRQETCKYPITFEVTFPIDLDVKMKAIITCAPFLMDFLYYENQ